MLATYPPFVQGYVECAFWTGVTDCNGNEAKNPLVENLAQPTFLKMLADCTLFQQLAVHLLQDLDPAQAGHDFWLTRNGHGAGFWDLGERGDRLTELCEKFDQDTLYVGDDGQIHSDNEHLLPSFAATFPPVVTCDFPPAHFNW